MLYSIIASQPSIYRVSQKTWTFFENFNAITPSYVECTNDVLLSDGDAYGKWRHNVLIIQLTPFPVFCNVETAS